MSEGVTGLVNEEGCTLKSAEILVGTEITKESESTLIHFAKVLLILLVKRNDNSSYLFIIKHHCVPRTVSNVTKWLNIAFVNKNKLKIYFIGSIFIHSSIIFITNTFLND